MRQIETVVTNARESKFYASRNKAKLFVGRNTGYIQRANIQRIIQELPIDQEREYIGQTAFNLLKLYSRKNGAFINSFMI